MQKIKGHTLIHPNFNADNSLFYDVCYKVVLRLLCLSVCIYTSCLFSANTSMKQTQLVTLTVNAFPLLSVVHVNWLQVYVFWRSFGGKSGTRHRPAPLKSSEVWQWLCKPLPKERVVTVAGGQSGRSVGMAQGLPACLLASAASSTGHRNKDSGLSQHLASLWPLKAITNNMCNCVCVHTHITVHESWPRFPVRVLACHLTKPNNSSEQMPGFQGQTDGWAKWLWIRITLLTHKGGLGFWLSGCYVFR